MDVPLCERCSLDFSLYPRNADGRCPNCGAGVDASTAHATSSDTAEISSPAAQPVGSIATYFTVLKALIFSPTAFFRKYAQQIIFSSSLAQILTFALVTEWLASFANFTWKTVAGAALERAFNSVFQAARDMTSDGMDQAPISMITGQNMEAFRSRVTDFLFGAGSIILTPFTTLIKLSLMAVCIHVAVKLFFRQRQDRPQSYTTTLKILAFATAPAILCVIPGIGILASWVLSFTIAVVGFREVYRGTAFRATMVVLFPSFLMIGIFMMLLITLMILGISIFQFIS